MTKKTKLIVGAVVVLGAYYLYTKNKAKSEVADLKEGANAPLLASSTIEIAELPKPIEPLTPVLPVGGGSIQLAEVGNKFSNFDGGRKNSMFAQYFR